MTARGSDDAGSRTALMRSSSRFRSGASSFPEVLQALVERAARRVNNGIGLPVQRGASLEDAAQVVHRLCVAGHGSRIALRDDARHMFLGQSLQPDRVARGQQQIVSTGFGDDASARGHHAAVVPPQDSFQAASLIAPIPLLPVQQEDLGEAGTGLAVDFTVELDERHAELLCKARTEARLAGAAQAEERDALRPLERASPELAYELGAHLRELLRWQALQKLLDQRELRRLFVLRAEQLGERQAERHRDLLQQQHRDVPLTGLELREVALRDARLGG